MVGIGLASAVVNTVYEARYRPLLRHRTSLTPGWLELLLATPQLLIRQQDELEMRGLAQGLHLDPALLLDAARQGLAQGRQAAFPRFLRRVAADKHGGQLGAAPVSDPA